MQVGLSDHALSVHVAGQITTVVRRADIVDVALREATRWRRGLLTVTVRRGHMLSVPFRRWQNEDMRGMYEDLRSS